jgi:hypothetical protein
MTRTSRTLLILVLMSIGAVVVLAMMAQRYNKVLEARQRAEQRGDRPVAAAGVPEVLPEQDARRHVEAYLQVMGSLSSGVAELGEDAEIDEAARARLRVVFERALVENGLDRAEFQEIDSVVRAWQEGSPEVPGAHRRELDRRADEVTRTRLESYDPLER